MDIRSRSFPQCLSSSKTNPSFLFFKTKSESSLCYFVLNNLMIWYKHTRHWGSEKEWCCWGSKKHQKEHRKSVQKSVFDFWLNSFLFSFSFWQEHKHKQTWQTGQAQMGGVKMNWAGQRGKETWKQRKSWQEDWQGKEKQTKTREKEWDFLKNAWNVEMRNQWWCLRNAVHLDVEWNMMGNVQKNWYQKQQRKGIEKDDVWWDSSTHGKAADSWTCVVCTVSQHEKHQTCLFICFDSEGGVKNKLKIEFVFVVMNIVPCKTLDLRCESFMTNVNTLIYWLFETLFNS